MVNKNENGSLRAVFLFKRDKNLVQGLSVSVSYNVITTKENTKNKNKNFKIEGEEKWQP